MIKMRKISKLVIFCLGLSAVFSLCPKSFAEVNWNLKAPKDLPEEGIAQEPPLSGSRQKPGDIIRPEIEYKGEGLKDPFLPLLTEKKIESIPAIQKSEAAKELPVLTVQGLIWGGAFPQAIINNKVVRIGDAIGEVKIKAIDRDGVTVLFANMEHKLTPAAAAKAKSPEPKEPSSTQMNPFPLAVIN